MYLQDKKKNYTQKKTAQSLTFYTKSNMMQKSHQKKIGTFDSRQLDINNVRVTLREYLDKYAVLKSSKGLKYLALERREIMINLK